MMTLRKYCLILCLTGLLSTGVLAQNTRSLSGTIDSTTPFVDVAFVVPDNGTITIDLMATSGDLDTYTYLIGPAGNILTWNDDVERGNTNSTIVYPRALGGTYSAVATRYGVEAGETSGDFSLTISVAPTVTVETTYTASAEALSAAGFPVIEPRPLAEWTVIAYYGGDTNLEHGILHDLKEFENAGGSDSTVRVVALFDRNPENFVSDPDWHSSRIYEVTATTDPDPDTLSSTAITDLGVSQVTGDGQFFARYMAWAVEHFPAQHYALAFGSHGAAWEGLIQDDTPNAEDAPETGRNARKDLLSLSELKQAMQLVMPLAGVAKFDLLINDACSMSSVEYFSVMDDFFHTSIASPEVVIDPALDMTLLTSLLNAQPEGNVPDFARQLVDKYIDTDIRTQNSPDLPNLNHAVTDLDNYAALTRAVESFAQVFNRNPRAFAPIIGKARHDSTTYVYSSFLGSTTKIDLGTFMQSVVFSALNPALRNAALDVLDRLADVRIYARNGGNPALDNASYYNIYFPEDESTFRPTYLDETPLVEWGRMLRSYYSANNPSLASIIGDTSQDFHPPIAPRINITSAYPLAGGESSIDSPVIVDTEVVGRNIAYVDTTTDQRQADGTYVRLATERVLLDVPTETGIQRVNEWSPGVTQRSVVWDVTLPGLYESDPTTAVFELITFTQDVAYLDAYYAEPGSTTYHDVTVIFNAVSRATDEEGRVIRVISRSPSSETAADIEIPVGSTFIPFRQTVTADGVTTLDLSPNRLTWPEGGVRYRWLPAPDGDYTYGLLATAFGGTTGYNKTNVVVANSQRDTALRGETAPLSGFTLLRPMEWNRLVYSLGDLEPYALELYRTSSEDGRQDVSVYIISRFDNDGEPIPHDLNFIANKLAEVGGLTLVGTPESATLQGVPALAIRYTFDSAAGLVTGHALITYNEANISGDIFAAESLDGEGDALNTTFALLTDGVHLFDVNEVADAQTPSWYTDYFNDTDPGLFRLPWTWWRAEGDANHYAEEGNPDATTFFEWWQFPLSADNSTLSAVLASNAVLTAGLTDITYDNPRSYANASAWDAIPYTATRHGQSVRGRFYRAEASDQVTVLQVETLNDATAAETFLHTLEILVDTVAVQ